MLKALADVDKKDILHLLDSIEKTFSPYWDQYPPYQTLKSRMENTREILKLSSSSNQNGKGSYRNYNSLIASSIIWKIWFND